jgi:methanogenic corrinoid protein MtbC1
VSVGEVEPSPAAGTGEIAELQQTVLAASQRLDAAGVSHTLTEAATAVGLPDCIDQVILPVMSQIGRWWAAGEYSIPQEQMTTEAVRAWLDHRGTLVSAPRHAQPVLLACGPRDRHTIGAEALALLLRIQGWQCRMLGARISVANLLTAALAMTPAAVVLVSHLAANRRLAVEALTGVHRADIVGFYAGNAFASQDNRRDVPGIYLGTSIQGACSQICHILDAADQNG